MRFSCLFLALTAAASAAMASSLAQQIGSVPAFLQLQGKHFEGASLSADEHAEFVHLGKQLHQKSPSTLHALTGTSNKAQQFVHDLLADQLHQMSHSNDSNQDHPSSLHQRDGSPASPVGQVPQFLTLVSATQKGKAGPDVEAQLIQHGVAMLSKGYKQGTLKTLLGTDSKGKDLLDKILQEGKTKRMHVPPPAARNVKPGFTSDAARQARRAHLRQRRSLAF